MLFPKRDNVSELSEKDSVISAKDNEIKRLKEQLAQKS